MSPAPPPRALVTLSCLFVTVPACAPKWKTDKLIDPREVARALDDHADVDAAPFDPKSVPKFDPPEKLRPCCAFGQDLAVQLGKVAVPTPFLKNIRGLEDLGPHGYDKGELTRENNGLVYTCRGGFIDIAHVRDNADRALYLSLAIARALPGGVTIEMPWEGTTREITVDPLPDGLLRRYGRWRVATTLAAWANQQLSNWHEIVTWHGWESVAGIPERLSAFSPEDIYSNVLGTRLAVGIVMSREMKSRAEYDDAMQAWMREGLRRLGAVPRKDAHAAMAAVDGLWWDSKKGVPAFELVTRRFIDIGLPVEPWIVEDVVKKPEVEAMCAGQPPPLALDLPEKLGEHKINDLVHVRFGFTKWVPERFPVPAAEGDTVTPDQFPKIMESIRADGIKQLGPDFDSPKPAAKKPAEKQADAPKADAPPPAG